MESLGSSTVNCPKGSYMHAVLYSRREKGIQLDQSANGGATPTLTVGAPEHESACEETESARLEENRRGYSGWIH